MNAYEVPLTPEPQRFSIELGGVRYRLRFQWCRFTDCWCMDVFDVGGDALLTGVPVVTGVDMLRQHLHIIDGGMIVQTDHNPDEPPRFDNLGSTSHLYFIVP